MKNNYTFLEKLLDGAEVEWKPLNKIVTTITAPVKLKREMYCSTGSTPIIDQGEKFIAGYTDENFEAIPSNEYIIFGDHSEHIKYVNFSFIQGADGLKILKPKEDNAKYIYYAFQNFYVKELNYKRHWSSAKETLIPLPPPTVQTEIVRILDALTALTSELTSELILRQKQYEYYREKLLSEEELGKVGFEWKCLKNIFNIFAGGDVPKESYSENKTEEFNIPILSNGIGDKSLYGWTNKAKINKPSLTISARGTIGWTSYREKPFYPIVRLLVLTPKIELNLKYTYHFMKMIEKNYKVPESGIPQLTKPMIEDLRIPVPSFSEQQHIVSILDKFETLTNSITEGLPLAIEQSQNRYEYYRELLLNF